MDVTDFLDPEDVPEVSDMVNPFIRNVLIDAYKWKSKKYMISPNVDDEGNRYYLTEAARKSSVFCSVNNQFMLIEMAKRGTKTMLMFNMMMLRVGVGKERIRLHEKKWMKLLDISRPTFYICVKNLINLGVIDRHTKSMYWINPFIFFKGDRLKKYKDNIQIRREFWWSPKN